MSTYLPIPISVQSEGGLANYIQMVNSLPMLSVEEERDLATRYREQGDLDAARQLVMSHLRYVVRVARGLKGYGLPEADLIQEGNIGLMKAVKSFDPSRNVRLVSFAVHWIRAEIYDYILRNWRIVKVATTKAQRKLFFNLRKSRTRLGWLTQEEGDNLAENLNVNRETVDEMEMRMTGTDIAFDMDNDSDDDSAYIAPAGYLQDMRYNPESLASVADQESSRQEQLQDALASLDERSRDIVMRRWLDEDNKPTLHDLAEEYGVSAERIRQIEKKALGTMKNVLAA
ncbi:MAG: RNA polymerase factor sigma-32 [Thiotrichales bacterium SG8_50]|jgi:RNA polymerase sigma-32 factor|nr:MAG: RNA polymerase factor sigma-32 [Thiotrichales bacterium SG8_50]